MHPTPKKSVSPKTSVSKISLDRPLHAAVARFTLGISPAALSQAYIDWLQHIVFSPDKQFELVEMAAREWARYLEYCRSACADPNFSIAVLIASTFRRECSVSNFCRTICRDNFASTMRPDVAATAATAASNNTSMFGIARPMNDMVVQVGGANAGSTLSTNTTMNRTDSM
jgi:hypothetical protein